MRTLLVSLRSDGSSVSKRGQTCEPFFLQPLASLSLIFLQYVFAYLQYLP